MFRWNVRPLCLQCQVLMSLKPVSGSLREGGTKRDDRLMQAVRHKVSQYSHHYCLQTKPALAVRIGRILKYQLFDVTPSHSVIKYLRCNKCSKSKCIQVVLLLTKFKYQDTALTLTVNNTYCVHKDTQWKSMQGLTQRHGIHRICDWGLGTLSAFDSELRDNPLKIYVSIYAPAAELRST